MRVGAGGGLAGERGPGALREGSSGPSVRPSGSVQPAGFSPQPGAGLLPAAAVTQEKPGSDARNCQDEAGEEGPGEG